MRRMWLRWRRNCMALSVLVVMGMTGAVVNSGQASGVVVSHPPGLLSYIHRDLLFTRNMDPAQRAEEAQAAAAMAALKALFPMPSPVPAPTPVSSPAATVSASSATPVPAVPATVSLPPRGQATAYGCPAALDYLDAYAAPGFIIACVINPNAHQATTTCISGYSLCSLGRFIMISDPCPAAYMNEASNSWVLLGLSKAPIDPYGKCS